MTNSSTNQWQPIETAPKDGASVLLFIVMPPCNYAESVGEPNGWSQIDRGYWDAPNNEWWRMTAGEPTHWMPLPPPPHKGTER